MQLKVIQSFGDYELITINKKGYFLVEKGNYKEAIDLINGLKS